MLFISSSSLRFDLQIYPHRSEPQAWLHCYPFWVICREIRRTTILEKENERHNETVIQREFLQGSGFYFNPFNLVPRSKTNWTWSNIASNAEALHPNVFSEVC